MGGRTRKAGVGDAPEAGRAGTRARMRAGVRAGVRAGMRSGAPIGARPRAAAWVASAAPTAPVALLVPFAAFAAFALGGCDGGDVIARPSSDAVPVAFADAVSDAPAVRVGPGASLLEVRARLSGASARADEVDLALDWRVLESGIDALGPAARLEAVLVDEGGARRTLARTRVSADAAAGRIDLVLTPPVSGSLELELRGLDGAVAGDPATRVGVDLPAVVAPAPTPLARLESLGASLVPGSASSDVRDGRRVHRFAVRVTGTLAGRAGAVSAVTGLERDVDAHFAVLEGGHADPESPVRAAWRGEPIAVYLVLDASASIVRAGADAALLDAVARTVNALAPVASFDYRAVTGEVRRLPDLRSLAFDDVADGSGTAFHRGVDTALDDIEARGEAHAVIVGFTDGHDFASRNFYPALGSDDEVLAHVAARLARSRENRARTGGLLEAHFVGLGADVDVGALDALAAAGGGRHVPSDGGDALADAFAGLADGLRGLYRLEYDSQRLAGDADLELEVRAGEMTARVALP